MYKAFASMLADFLHQIVTASSLSLLWREKDVVSWSSLDLQNLQFLRFADLLHIVSEAIG